MNKSHKSLSIKECKIQASILLKSLYSNDFLISQKAAKRFQILPEKASWQAQYEHAQPMLEKLQSSHAALNQATQEMQIKYHSLSQDQTRLVQQYQDQYHDLKVKKQSVMELQVKAAAYEDKIALLEKTLVKADDKIQTLRDDFSFVSQENENLEGQIKQLQKLISIKQVAV